MTVVPLQAALRLLTDWQHTAHTLTYGKCSMCCDGLEKGGHPLRRAVRAVCHKLFRPLSLRLESEFDVE